MVKFTAIKQNYENVEFVLTLLKFKTPTNQKPTTRHKYKKIQIMPMQVRGYEPSTSILMSQRGSSYNKH